MFENIGDYIKQGLSDGYHESVFFQRLIEFKENVREYLLTVSIAKKLSEWNTSEGHAYRIELGSVSFFL